MDWLTYIDLYCERTAPGFWNEPVNAISNAAFVIAALWGWFTARAMGRLTPLIGALLILAGAIGIGSFLFHTLANAWSEHADVIPIWSFVSLYIYAAITLVGKVKPKRIIIGFLIVIAVLIITMLAITDTSNTGHSHPGPLNGSGQYIPALVALVVFSILTIRRNHPMKAWFIGATVMFVIALIFRTIDPLACAVVPIGTHFIWHVMNGAMVALLLQGLIRSMPALKPTGVEN